MNRRNFVQSTGLAIPLTSIPSWMQALHFSAFDMKPIRRNVGYFTERGGTIGWLIQPQSRVIIDAQFPEQAGHLINELKKQPDATLRYLINTHHHGDHTAGNIAFKGIANNVLAHENSKINQLAAAQKNNNESEQLYPDMTFTERWQEKIDDEVIDMQYWGPGHTNGDSIIHFHNANVVHCGDLVFNRRYPYIDSSAGARIDNWIEILQQLQTYFDNDTIYIFGHAAEGYKITGGKEDLTAFADYLSALLEFVSSSLKEGKSHDEIMRAKEIPGAPQWKGDGIERSLTAAIQELEKN
ncbi:MAG: MBL fold metallo-hydrolase [Bacteroidota bacterium]|nr:MBL fold metallo-hydrolase [Bacteroidota bacterium]